MNGACFSIIIRATFHQYHQKISNRCDHKKQVSGRDVRTDDRYPPVVLDVQPCPTNKRSTRDQRQYVSGDRVPNPVGKLRWCVPIAWMLDVVPKTDLRRCKRTGGGAGIGSGRVPRLLMRHQITHVLGRQVPTGRPSLISNSYLYCHHRGRTNGATCTGHREN